MKIVIVGYGVIASALVPILKKELGRNITSIKIVDPEIDTATPKDSQELYSCIS